MPKQGAVASGFDGPNDNFWVLSVVFWFNLKFKGWSILLDVRHYTTLFLLKQYPQHPFVNTGWI
jgi:hypothetical protein